MAAHLLSYVVADLCLGKPPLRSLPDSATVGDALAAIKSSDDKWITIWSCCCCHHTRTNNNSYCTCIGKISMVDIICYLVKFININNNKPFSCALASPISVLMSPISATLVTHMEPTSSLLEAIDVIVQGSQNLVVPITKRRENVVQKSSSSSSSLGWSHKHNGCEYCWVSEEDVMRLLVSSIGVFSPIPSLTIEALGIVTPHPHLSSVCYHSPASEAIQAISHSLADQTSVGVVDHDGFLIGEISPFTLGGCDENVVAAIATLSTGELMAYIDCGGPPEDLMRIVKARLEDMNLEGQEFQLNNNNISSSSDSDSDWLPTQSHRSYSARIGKRAEAIVCHPWSSLVAVMIQAIAHRVKYVWVVQDDCHLVGIVTFSNMLRIFRDHLMSLPRY